MRACVCACVCVCVRAYVRACEGVDSIGSGVFNAEAIGGLPQNETTFATVLKAQGYATMAIG